MPLFPISSNCLFCSGSWYELTEKEKGRFYTLKQEIENLRKKKSLMSWKSKQNENIIAKKFTKIGDEAQKILTTKIPYSEEGRKGVFTLPCYAISLENNQAFETFLQEATKRKFLKDLLNDELTGEILGVQKTTYTVLAYCILKKNSKAVRAVLEASKENGILKDILKKRIIIKHSNGKEMTYTPFTYAEACENSEAVEEILKFSGELVNRRATQRPTVVTAKTTTAKDENSKEVCKYSVTNKDTTHAIDKATETDTKLCESSEEVQNDSTAVEPTSVDRETNEQEPNSLSPAEPYFDSRSGNTVDEKSSKKAIQPIVAGIVGTALLVSCVASYLLIEYSKAHVIALIGGIVGLVCMGFALYNAIKPNTKLEKVKDAEQLDLQNLKASLKDHKCQVIF